MRPLPVMRWASRVNLTRADSAPSAAAISSYQLRNHGALANILAVATGVWGSQNSCTDCAVVTVLRRHCAVVHVAKN